MKSSHAFILALALTPFLQAGISRYGAEVKPQEWWNANGAQAQEQLAKCYSGSAMQAIGNPNCARARLAVRQRAA